jgi:hypothetical protein
MADLMESMVKEYKDPEQWDDGGSLMV